MNLSKNYWKTCRKCHIMELKKNYKETFVTIAVSEIFLIFEEEKFVVNEILKNLRAIVSKYSPNPMWYSLRVHHVPLKIKDVQKYFFLFLPRGSVWAWCHLAVSLWTEWDTRTHPPPILRGWHPSPPPTPAQTAHICMYVPFPRGYIGGNLLDGDG